MSIGSTAQAQTKWTGAQSAEYSGASIFTITQGAGGIVTITVAQGTGPTYLDDIGGTGGVSGQLLGISGIWVVGTGGKSVSGITAKSSTISSPNATWKSESSPAGFGGQNGYGNSPKSNWIALASPTTLVYYDKTSDGYTNGVFTFTTLTSSPAFSSDDIGIDYLIADGKGKSLTGRAYFAPGIVSGSPPSAPEPATVLPFALVALMLTTAAVRRRLQSDRQGLLQSV